MKDIPLLYVRANQTGIVIFILLAVSLQEPVILAALWVIQLTGLLFGPQSNLFVIAAKQFLIEYPGQKSESAELQRFNTILGLVFLTASLLSFALGFNLAGYLFASAFALAGTVALLGFCIGCFLYYNFKKLVSKGGSQ